MKKLRLVGTIVIVFAAGTITFSTLASAENDDGKNPLQKILDAIQNLQNQTTGLQNQINTLQTSSVQTPQSCPTSQFVTGFNSQGKIICSGGVGGTFFKDDYSSSAGWTQRGTGIAVNDTSSPGVVKFNKAGGGDDNRVVKQLNSTLQVKHWIVDFDYEVTASNIPQSYPFVLTSISVNQALQTNLIEVLHGPNVDQLSIVDPPDPSSTPIPISQNTQYYVRLERTPTQLELFVFSDSARTMNIPGSPVTVSISENDFRDLNFIQHSGCITCGPGRTLTAQLDNTTIYLK